MESAQVDKSGQDKNEQTCGISTRMYKHTYSKSKKKKNRLPACESAQTDKLVNIKDLLMESAQVGKRKEDSDYVRQNVSSRKT